MKVLLHESAGFQLLERAKFAGVKRQSILAGQILDGVGICAEADGEDDARVAVGTHTRG